MLIARLTTPLLQSTRTTCFRPMTIRLYPCTRPFFTTSLLRTTPIPTPTPPKEAPTSPPPTTKDLYENIYTIPNALTLARIAATPVIGHFVLHGQFAQATTLLLVAGVSDVVDGYLARKYNMGSVLGSILDPAADKFLMTTMVVTLAIKGMLPLPLAILIIGRDVLLSISAFYFRYNSLPPPVKSSSSSSSRPLPETLLF